jgi:hypothetical protein
MLVADYPHFATTGQNQVWLMEINTFAKID